MKKSAKSTKTISKKSVAKKTAKSEKESAPAISRPERKQHGNVAVDCNCNCSMTVFIKNESSEHHPKGSTKSYVCEPKINSSGACAEKGSQEIKYEWTISDGKKETVLTGEDKVTCSVKVSDKATAGDTFILTVKVTGAIKKGCAAPNPKDVDCGSKTSDAKTFTVS